MPAPYTNPSQSQLQQKRKIFLGADKFASFGVGTLTRGGKGNFYQALAASATAQLITSLSLPITDYASGKINYKNTGSMNGDLAFNSVTVFYLVAAAAITLATVGVSQTTFGNASVPFVTDLIAPTPLPLLINTNIQQATVTPPDAGRLIINPAEIAIEVDFTTGGGQVHFYGVLLDVMYSR